MNLKEAFRYQNFLDRMFGAAALSIQKRDHCLTQTSISPTKKQTAPMIIILTTIFIISYSYLNFLPESDS